MKVDFDRQPYKQTNRTQRKTEHRTMQTRSQTIAELRKENETMKLMIFGGELGKGSIFQSVGFVEQLERKDAQMEEMQKELDDLRSRQEHQTLMFLNPAADKYINGLKEQCEYWKDCYKMQEKETDIEHQRYLEYLEKHSEVQNSYELLATEKDEEIQTYKDTLDDHHVHYDNLKKKFDDIEGRYEVMEQTWISEEDADRIHDDYLESIDELKMELDDMKCIALVNWSGGFLTWDYDNRKPVAKVGKYHNIEKSVPEEWDAVLNTLN